MTDTIELLEAIGRDATLRHASVGELTIVLEQSQASTAFKAAVALGDNTLLLQELGFGLIGNQPLNHPPQIQSPGHDDEEPEEGEDAPPQTPPDPDHRGGSGQP